MANKASKAFELINEARAKIASNMDRGFTLAHVFQHAKIVRGKDEHELQKAATWNMINDNELTGILSDFHFDGKAEMIFSVRQLVAFKLILDKSPLAKGASDDMIKAAKFADQLLGLSKMQVVEKTKKSTSGAYGGKNYSAK